MHFWEREEEETGTKCEVVATCYVIYYGSGNIAPHIYLFKPDVPDTNGLTRVLKFANVFEASQFLKINGLKDIKIKRAAA